MITTSDKRVKKIYLYIGLSFNLGLLGYFKYADFFITNTNAVFGLSFENLNLVLPLAISFFTLQQIAFLVDSYGGLVKERNFTSYTLFVLFFPQLIAGPIVHHKEMMPQFKKLKNHIINYDNIAKGIFLFSLGLFKKVVIADTFASYANAGYSFSDSLNILEGWVTSLSYTFQLYFDFSGYTDMAIGVALLFNIRLPENFNSPYKAKSIVEFWNRWHMTLTRFLTTYIYEPIVKSSRKFSFHKAMFATFVTMLIAGFWHGAAWTFVVFGIMHGSALVINHYFKRSKRKLNTFLAWFLTFNFLNISFVIFRAPTMHDAYNVLHSMFFGNIVLNFQWFDKLHFLEPYVSFGAWLQHVNANYHVFVYLLLALLIVLVAPNSTQIVKKMQYNIKYLIFGTLIFVIAVLDMNKVSEFLYFNF